MALKSVTVSGNMIDSFLRVGFDAIGAGINADVALGKMLVKGNWSASSLAVGVEDTTGDGFGRNDALINVGGHAEIIAKIASLIIKGTATGSATPTDDFFGITAQTLGKLTIHDVKQQLSAGANDLLLDAINNDFRAVDFA